MTKQDHDFIAYLDQHCLPQLKDSFVALKHRVPRCKASMTDLLPAVSRSIALGFHGPLEQLSSYVGSVSLEDLMLVAACLRGDDAALLHFCELIVPRVSDSLRRNFATRASPTVICDVVDQLAGHCFEEATKGTHAGMPRLSSFLGRSSLSTWMYAVAARMLQSALRQRKSLDGANRPTDMASIPSGEVPPDMKMASDESCKLGEELRRRLTVPGQTHQDRAAFSVSPSPFAATFGHHSQWLSPCRRENEAPKMTTRKCRPSSSLKR